MPSLLIIWHSRTGTAEALASAAARAAMAAEPDLIVTMVPAASVTPELMHGTDAYIFVCPENLATMSGAMKEMVDTLYYPLLGRVEGRTYALIIAAGTDGAGAVRQWHRIAAGWRLKAVAEPLIVLTGADTPETILAPKKPSPNALSKAADLGAAFACGLMLGIY